MLHYYLTFSFHLKLALLTQLPTLNERKIPPQLKIKPAKFHNGGFAQDLYMHICSIFFKFYQYWPTVYDVGPTLGQHWIDVSRLLGNRIKPKESYTFLAMKKVDASNGQLTMENIQEF